MESDWLHAWQQASIATLRKKMEYQEFFRQDILAEDFHCDSELLAVANDEYESGSHAGSTCVRELRLAQPLDLAHAVHMHH